MRSSTTSLIRNYGRNLGDSNVLTPEEGTATDNTGQCFAYVGGRLFDYWIDSKQGSSRSNGYNEGEQIFIVPYIIESLIRDEKLSERKLHITTVTDTTHIISTELSIDIDDFYNYATYYNATTGHKTFITDYDGASKELVLNDADSSATINDNIFLQNVRGDYKVDITTFDALGNTTNGTRAWTFSLNIIDKTSVDSIISALAFESHCEFIKSISLTGEIGYKIVAIDSDSGDTWTNPAYEQGVEKVTSYLTPLENVYTEFKLNYAYDLGKGNYTKQLFVDKNGFTSTMAIIGSTEQTLCADAESNYKISNPFEYSSKLIYDDTTAENMLQKKIEWFTKRRLVVNYTTQICGTSDWIKYEKGDQVKLNFSKGIPAGLNNSSMFMITNKTITPLIGGGHISWKLIEL